MLLLQSIFTKAQQKISRNVLLELNTSSDASSEIKCHE